MKHHQQLDNAAAVCIQLVYSSKQQNAVQSQISSPRTGALAVNLPVVVCMLNVNQRVLRMAPDIDCGLLWRRL